MPGKKLIIILTALVLAASVFADDAEEGPAAFSFVFGPRIGGSYVVDTPEKFSAGVNKLYPGDYFPAVTLFGITLEQRILLGQTRSHFAFQEVVLIGGLEQGIVLPEGAFLIGYRDYSGFEFGIGPIVHVGGISVVAALGWTFSFRGAYVPIDISLIIPNKERPASISITTGFNFQVSRRERQESRQPEQTQGAEKSPKTQEPQAPQSSK